MANSRRLAEYVMSMAMRVAVLGVVALGEIIKITIDAELVLETENANPQ